MLLRPHHEKASWYADGLRFACTRCGTCCTGPPGYVWLTDDEVAAIAGVLGMPVPGFLEQYCRRAWSRLSLRERPNGDCILLTPKGCAAYTVRPSQCRTFPFWRHNLASRGAWEKATARCRGAGQGRLYSCDEIEGIAGGRAST